MSPTPVSAGLGLLIILTGAAAVWLIFDASTRSRNPTARDCILRTHGIAGYLFIAIFCFMTWFMLLRVKDTPDELPLRSMLHVLIAMVLACVSRQGCNRALLQELHGDAGSAGTYDLHTRIRSDRFVRWTLPAS